MPDLEFEGKSAVYAHHLGVEARDLRSCAKRSEMTRAGGGVALDGSLIVHGDNLHALKALLPRYEGKVNCVYIDPPYNTGNEGWCYNDKVNSPLMKKWLKENGAVDGEDAMRHDKWLCMMWPRLKLLQQLLADDGVIFVSIDDNEQAHLRAIMNEIFGEENFVANIIWHKKNVVQNDAKFLSSNHDYVLCYSKYIERLKFNLVDRTEEQLERYQNPDNDPRGRWISVALQAKSGSKSTYIAKFDNGVTWQAPSGTYPRLKEETLYKYYKEGRLWFGKSGNNVPRLKKYLSEVQEGTVFNTIWHNSEVGSTQSSKELLKTILNDNIFATPKPVKIIKRILMLTTDKKSIVLDSFAGSGTTAHAVLELNKEDGGKRKFILVECEDYADTTTAERVRRVINGVPNAKKDSLHEGTGGSFTYCTLGETMTVENMLQSEKGLPEYETLASHVFWIATGKSLNAIPKAPARGEDGLFGETEECLYYLVYEADRKFLLSNDSALNITRAQRIAKTLAAKKKKEAVVFATQVFLDHKDLAKHRITFSQLPYCIE